MPDRQNPKDVFLEHLAWINKVAGITSRKHGRWGDEADDFAAWVQMRIIQDDYALLGKFRGESEITTFLATVVTRLSHAYSRERRGRWRPSAAATRLGPPAPELELLVRRDGYPLSQAGEKLRTEGRTDMSDAQLARLLAQVPERGPLRPVQVGADAVLSGAEGVSRADERVAASEAEDRQRAMKDALDRALQQLAPEERMIVLMHFRDGRTLADVARNLHIDQKPLYRQAPRLRERFRELLIAEGVSPADLHELLEERES
ncbi:MAG TPA: sigma-70 family RNA polymerase sigma factor [Longimicrobium sp.]|nr:sigma-70 family RNA polymerase sigma factor [Longimicrobium sp.]